MGRLIMYFRRAHRTIVTAKAASRLAEVGRAMSNVDGHFRLGITGSDMTALLPRHVDVTLEELRRVLRIRSNVA